MRYELLDNGRGILVDRMSVLQDVEGAFEVSFLLPCKGQFVAVFIDDKNIKRQVQICDGIVTLPTSLLRPQYVRLYVVKVENDEVVKTWDCEQIKISNLGDMLGCHYEVSGGMSESAAIARLADIERTFAVELSAFKNQSEKYEQAIIAFNTAIEVINNLSERLAALENNYDPTVIK